MFRFLILIEREGPDGEGRRFPSWVRILTGALIAIGVAAIVLWRGITG